MEQGDFEKLYHQHFDRVYRTAYLITGDHQLAEDAAQEAFLKAFASLNTLRDTDKFASWVCVIAANYSVDLLRKNKKIIFTGESGNHPDNSPQSSPHEIWEKKEEIATIKEALASLEAEDRKLLVLKYFHEMSIKDIAALDSVSLGTVKSRLFRSREKLRHILQPAGRGKRLISKTKSSL